MTNLPPPFNAEIAGDDEMLLYALSAMKTQDLARAEYFRQGAEINDVIQQLLNWKYPQDKENIRFLDFASGYGRVTRFLVTNLPASNVWVSDIHAEAVAFQQRTFGVRGFTSYSDPRELDCALRFDVIFVGSLFTHLPAERFRQWLKRLFDLLEPSGVLAFSVHGEDLRQDIPETGILFVPVSESRTLKTSEYGATTVTEAFVRSMIEAAAGPGRRYRRLIRAMCDEHDIYIVCRDDRETFATLRFRRAPLGCVDWLKVSRNGKVELGGWAGDLDSNFDVEVIEVRVDGQFVTRTAPTLVRDDVARAYQNVKLGRAGWDCAFELATTLPGALLEVKALSNSGVSRVLLYYPLPVVSHTEALSIQLQPPPAQIVHGGFVRRFLARCAASISYRYRAMTKQKQSNAR